LLRDFLARFASLSVDPSGPEAGRNGGTGGL